MKNLAELRKQLIEWMNHHIYCWSLSSKQDWEDYITEDPSNNSFRMLFYTDKNSYSISVHHSLDGNHYLGCIASARKPRAGEDWTRGNDLPDGEFSIETFNRIMLKIVGYEMIAKAKPQKAQADNTIS